MKSWHYVIWTPPLLNDAIDGDPFIPAFTPDGDTNLSLPPSMSIFVIESVSPSVSNPDPVGDPFNRADLDPGDPIPGNTIKGFPTLVTCLIEPTMSSPSCTKGFFSKEFGSPRLLLALDWTLMSLGLDFEASLNNSLIDDMIVFMRASVVKTWTHNLKFQNQSLLSLLITSITWHLPHSVWLTLSSFSAFFSTEDIK